MAMSLKFLPIILFYLLPGVSGAMNPSTDASSSAPPSSSKNNDGGSAGGATRSVPWKPRASKFKWDGDVHSRFLKAVEMLGGAQSATPRAVFRLMEDIKGLKIGHVRTHVQVYRAHKYDQLLQEARNRAAMAGGHSTSGTSSEPPICCVTYPPHGYPYHHFYNAPPPQPSRLSVEANYEPTGPMPPRIPPSMRMLHHSDSGKKTIEFKELFVKEKAENVSPPSNGVKKLVGGSCSCIALSYRDAPVPSQTSLVSECTSPSPAPSSPAIQVLSLDLTLG